LKRVTPIAIIVLTVLLILATVAGCAPKAASPQPTPPPVSLTVAAAASLTDVLKEVDSLYMQGKPNVTVTPIFGGSGALQQQIENSGPAIDVFISAAAQQMDNLQKEQLLLDGTRENLLGNKLVLIVPNDSTLGITDFKDLAGDKVKHVAIGDPKSVPAGQYAAMVFQEDKIADQVKAKEVEENDVRGVLSAVESGNADAGIVFITDAMTSTKVKVVANAPDDINAQIVYPVAVIKASKNADAAKAYVAFLSSDPAKAIFQKYGFIVSSD
jgi:molybdate transport system substrate-binding protein